MSIILKRCSLICLFFFLLLIPSQSHGNQSIFYPCLKNLSDSDTITVAQPNGKPILERNYYSKHVPASTLKIFTALLAIQYLGQDYRFNTDFFLSSKGDLIVKGYGDPLFISEVIDQVASTLAQRIDHVKDIILDNSYFSVPITIPGAGVSTNPYDAPVGALCANFNTIYFDHDKNGNPVSAEPQTPLVPMAKQKALELKSRKGRYTLTHDSNESVMYAGQLLAYFLEKHGINIKGKVKPGRVKKGDRLLLSYYSPFNLLDDLKKMMQFSNNFIANQIFIAVGAKAFGPPGTLEKAVEIARYFAKERLKLSNITIVEGSGLSRENRISASDMLVILNHFLPYRRILRYKKGVFYKTGTLKGIKTCAGYFEPSCSQTYPFAIFLDHDFCGILSLLNCFGKKLGIQ